MLRTLYPEGLPARLWWVADTTTSDKPSAKQVFGIRQFWRGCRRPGQAATHQGHGWVLLAHLHRRPDRSWQALLVGALLWRQLRRASPGRLTAVLIAQLALSTEAQHVVVSDRGLSSRELVRALRARGCKPSALELTRPHPAFLALACLVLALMNQGQSLAILLPLEGGAGSLAG